MHFDQKGKKIESGESNLEARIAELQEQERTIFEEMRCHQVTVNELMERFERVPPENEGVFENYALILDAAVTKFYEAEQKWIKAVNELLEIQPKE